MVRPVLLVLMVPLALPVRRGMLLRLQALRALQVRPGSRARPVQLVRLALRVPLVLLVVRVVSDPPVRLAHKVCRVFMVSKVLRV